MTNIPERLLTSAKDAIVWTPFLGACGGLGGYLIAKASDLPPFEVAKNWAIFAVASNAIRSISLCFFENEKVNGVINATVSALTGSYFIYEMRTNDLMGTNMALFVASVHILAVLVLLANVLTNKQNDEVKG